MRPERSAIGSLAPRFESVGTSTFTRIRTQLSHLAACAARGRPMWVVLTTARLELGHLLSGRAAVGPGGGPLVRGSSPIDATSGPPLQSGLRAKLSRGGPYPRTEVDAISVLVASVKGRAN